MTDDVTRARGAEGWGAEVRERVATALVRSYTRDSGRAPSSVDYRAADAALSTLPAPTPPAVAEGEVEEALRFAESVTHISGSGVLSTALHTLAAEVRRLRATPAPEAATAREAPDGWADSDDPERQADDPADFSAEGSMKRGEVFRAHTWKHLPDVWIGCGYDEEGTEVSREFLTKAEAHAFASAPYPTAIRSSAAPRGEGGV